MRVTGTEANMDARDILSPGPVAAFFDFDETLLHGMLSFLLFAAALHVNLVDLSQQKYIISTLATLGVVGSTFIIGLASWWVLGWLGIDLPFIYCLLSGALISPTDPIAALAILGKVGLPPRLEAIVNGESLFNDGVGVVIFTIFLALALGTAPPAVAQEQADELSRARQLFAGAQQ